MAADFYAPGACSLLVKLHAYSQWKYLGTAVTAPEIEGRITSTPFSCDITGPAPVQEIFNLESHEVTTTLNRVNWETWRLLRQETELNFPTSVVDNGNSFGQVIYGYKDFQLYLRYEVSTDANVIQQPLDVTKSRLYFSCHLMDFKETTINNRIMEVSLLIHCQPKLTISVITIGGSQNPTIPKKIPATKKVFQLYQDPAPPISDSLLE